MDKRKGEYMEKIITKLRVVSRRIYHKYLRRDLNSFAKSLGVKVGENCNYVDDPEKIFGSEPWLIKVGNHVRFAFGVRIITHRGEIWVAREKNSRYNNSSNYAPVIIGDNVFIGMYSIIMPGVKIGDNVIIGAHSVVTHDIPENSVACGTPAVPISTMDKYLEKLSEKELFDVIHMNSKEKMQVIKDKHPEWFD